MSVRSGSLTAVLLVASALTGCGKTNPNDAWDTDHPVRYCVDASGQRTADEHCKSDADGRVTPGGSNGFLWYYVNAMNGRGSYSVPRVGAVAGGGSYLPETGVSYSSVSRGGFGGTAMEIGGHGGAGE